MAKYDEFQETRARLNERVIELGSLNTRRFMGMDAKLYEDGSLPRPTKELLGLVSSLVLRCDDCVAYHIDQCVQEGFTREQIMEAMDIGMFVGGSIVIPHLRRAVAFMDECFHVHDASDPDG